MKTFKLLLCTFVIVSVLLNCNSSFIAATSSNNTLNISAVLPKDVIFDHNIFVNVLDEDTEKIVSCVLESSKNYTTSVQLKPGKYSISGTEVKGEYDGYYICVPSKKTFEISSKLGTSTDLSIQVLFSQTDPEAADKKTEYGSFTPLDTIEQGEAEKEAALEDEKAAKAEQDQKEAENRAEKKNRGILSSSLLTLSLLVGLGLGFYYIKSKNEL